MPWDEQFEKLVKDVLPALDGAPLAPDTCLAEAGLDSLATIDLLVRLEEGYRTSLPDEALTSQTFATPASLWEALTAARATTSAGDGC